MAQTTSPPLPADMPRPLPRRTPASKNIRPRLVLRDGVWMLVLAALSLLVSTLLPHVGDRWWVGAVLAAGTVKLLYLLGWRARDWTTGVVAGLLTATSLPFALHAAAAPRDALLVLLTVASLFSFVAGSSLLALALAGLAAAARPDALLLGLVLLGLALAQRRRRAALGAAAFFVCMVGGWAAQLRLTHESLTPIVGVHGWLLTWAIAPGIVFLSWMLLPFCAELGEAPRRARWLPVVLWVVVYGVVESVVRSGDRAATVFGLMPLWFVLTAGGISRLLPTLTGEIPAPWARYLVTTLGVLSLLAMRFHAEWPLQRPATAQVTVPPPTPHTAMPLIPAAAVAGATAATRLHPTPAPPPKPSSKPAPKPTPPVKATATMKSLTKKPLPPAKKAPTRAATVQKRPAIHLRPVHRRRYLPRRRYRPSYR